MLNGDGQINSCMALNCCQVSSLNDSSTFIEHFRVYKLSMHVLSLMLTIIR